jgi:NAD(P)-dependent dehydrogenase (short-subunit alcohol dehydrogenase family)
MNKKQTSIEHFFKLEGKVAAVIGGAGFLCSTLAKAMADVGMRVAILDRKPFPEALSTQSTVASLNCDATNRADLERCHAELLQKFGRVDVLLNGAGINAPTPFLEISETEIHAIFDSHVTATVLACQVFGVEMIKNRSGSIINFASASSGPPLSKAFIYSVAKAGIANLTQNLAREWAPSNVRVNALRPGFFPTEWSMKHFIDEQRKNKILGHTPMGRFGTPDELVGAVLWLASEAATFVTGSLVAVDGGFTAMTI